MPVASTTVQPSGRGELLLWINNVCSAQYPSVESLRDGAAYCTVINATISRVAENCVALGHFEAKVAQARAKRASQLMGRVEWDITIVTCTNQDPSFDSLQERGHCEKNMQILQSMLRSCLPQEFSLEINVSRLAEGKLQEHILLLKWMYQFLTRMLSTYSRSALQRRIAAPERVGSVEGVRMTRTMRLQQKMVREKYIEPALLDSIPVSKAKPTERESGAIKELGIIKNFEKMPTGNDVNVTSLANLGSLPEFFVKEKLGALKRSQLAHEDEKDKSRHCLSALDLKPNVSFSGGIQSKLTDATHFTASSIPDEHCLFLEDLRRDVESYEALSFAAYKRYRVSLTGFHNDDESCSLTGTFAVESFIPKKTPVITLERLGLLLEERDKLWQTLAVMQDAILRCGVDLGGRREESKNVVDVSQLLHKILLAFSPP